MPRIGWHTTNSTSSVGDPCSIAVVDTTAGSRTPIPTAAGYRPGQRADAPTAGSGRPAPTAGAYRPGQRGDAPTAGYGRPAPTAGKKVPPVIAGFRFPTARR